MTKAMLIMISEWKKELTGTGVTFIRQQCYSNEAIKELELMQILSREEYEEIVEDGKDISGNGWEISSIIEEGCGENEDGGEECEIYDLMEEEEEIGGEYIKTVYCATDGSTMNLGEETLFIDMSRVFLFEN
ncbi:MAG: hypothetical protein ABIE68_04255 [bacterium]